MAERGPDSIHPNGYPTLPSGYYDDHASRPPQPIRYLTNQADLALQADRLQFLEALVAALAERATLPEDLVRQVMHHAHVQDMPASAILDLLYQAPDGPEDLDDGDEEVRYL